MAINASTTLEERGDPLKARAVDLILSLNQYMICQLTNLI